MADPEHKLDFDKQLLDVYLMGLQAEVEAKLRAVTRVREHMQRLDAAGSRSDKAANEEAARSLIAQIDGMLETNRVVGGTLLEIKAAAEALLADIREM